MGILLSSSHIGCYYILAEGYNKMSTIYERQYKELLTRELLNVLAGGRLPNIREISGHLSDSLRNKKILYEFIPQARKSVLNNKLFNRQLNAITFDINVLHQEILQQVHDAARRLNYADLYHRVHSYELEKLESLLTSILFTFENADFFFLGAFDNFTDYSKTDIDKSDQDIIFLPEKAIVLPYGGKNTKRIKSSHLYKHATWPVDLLLPAESDIISKGQLSSSSFGNIFSDIVAGWVYEVITKEQVQSKIQFKFPLAGPSGEEVEVKVNRFEIIPFSGTEQRALIELSTDNVNWKTPEGYEDGILMSDQKLTYALDFITELVQFVRITLIKSTFDEELSTNDEDKQFVYRFGLKGFSAYTVGRKQRARYQSKAFSFSGQEDRISRVSIKSDISTPDGTSADFSIALADSFGEASTSFRPIRPIGSDGKPGSNEVVVFGTTEPHQFRFEASANQFSQRGSPFRGHKYYNYKEPILPAAIFGTASMIRGHKVWFRDQNIALTRTEVRDNYITFAKVNTEHLYTVVTEVPVQRLFVSNAKNMAELTTSNTVYYTRGIHDLIPNFSQSSSDMTPTYAVYRVEHVTDTPKKTHNVSTSGKSKVLLPVSNFIITGSDSPVVQNSSKSVTYLAGRDYIVETETIGSIARPTGYLVIVPESQGGTIKNNSSLVLSITLVLDSDVTYKVADIQGNKVTLSKMTASSRDSFKITYRYIPLPPNTIEKASVRIKDNISNSPGIKFFVEGVDYVLDTRTGGIQRLPNGAIPDKGSVFADFLFRNAAENVETFLTWCFVASPNGARIVFDVHPSTQRNALVADEDIGEQFLVNLPSGLIDITRAESSPILGPGWVQFIVKSKNPDANKQTSGNLIDQVVQLRDINKKRVFKENGAYFKDIIALRDPMTQVTLNQLLVNTLPSDHTVFAIDSTKVTEPVVVLNFNPGDTKELYLKVPQDEASTSTEPATIPEIYTISWESKVESLSSESSVIVRCDLSRDPDIDGSITPKVFSYFLRASEL